MAAPPVLPPSPQIFVCDVSAAFADRSWAEQHIASLHRPLADKAARFVQERDKVLSSASKLLLSHAVHCITGALPADVMRQPVGSGPHSSYRFSYARHGQPVLLPSCERWPQLYMSLSHHSNVVAVALAAVPVGVDVVDARQLIQGSVVDVFKDVLHPLEARRLQGVSPPLQLREFLMVWALKECAAKIDGRGIAMPMQQLLVRPHALQHVDGIGGARPCAAAAIDFLGETSDSCSDDSNTPLPCGDGVLAGRVWKFTDEKVMVAAAVGEGGWGEDAACEAHVRVVQLHDLQQLALHTQKHECV